MIAKREDTGFKRFRCWMAVGYPVNSRGPVSNQQVESSERVKPGLLIGDKLFSARGSKQIIRHQLASGARIQCRLGFAKIGQGSEPTTAGDSHPAATGFQVSSGTQGGVIWPEASGFGRPMMKLITVCSDDKGIRCVSPDPN